MTENKTTGNPTIDSMFKAGAHFGYSKSRRHPTISPYIFGVKNKVEIFDLEKTTDLLAKAKDFVTSLAKEGKQILFVGGKNEAREAISSGAHALGMPVVAGRWIGGTLSNFSEIKKRIAKFEKLTADREKGELAKYTKKERLLIDREIANLDRFFSGLLPMKELPKALFVIDSKKEKIAIKEARDMGVPVIALLGSDCNMKEVDYPILGNDSSASSIKFFVNEIVAAYKNGQKAK